MSDSANNAPGYDSSDTEILIVDGPGDTTVRPARPILRQKALEERERLARWQQISESENS